jgi:hypothetical protein
VLRINPDDPAAKESRWYLRIRNLRATGPKTTARKMVAEIIAPDAEDEFGDAGDDETDEPQARKFPQLAVLVLIGLGLLVVVVLVLTLGL